MTGTVSASSRRLRNEPPTDFTRPENRELFRAALGEVRGQLGRSYPLVLGGEEVARGRDVRVPDPGDSARVIGRFPKATPSDASRAIAIAREALAAWSSTPARAARGGAGPGRRDPPPP